MANLNKCKLCKHWVHRDGLDGIEGWCNYLSNTGISKVKNGINSDDCTVFECKDIEKAQFYAEVEKMTKEGFSDKEMAKKFDCKITKIKRTRLILGLKRTRVNANKTYDPKATEKVKKYFDEGLTDKEIADKIGYAISTITVIRSKNGWYRRGKQGEYRF